MSKAVDLSAIVTAISIAGAAVATVLYFTDDQQRQDSDHLDEAKAAQLQVEIVEAKEDAAEAEDNRLNWRLSEYRRAEAEGRLSEGGKARYENLQEDAKALEKKKRALERERELYQKKAEGFE